MESAARMILVTPAVSMCVLRTMDTFVTGMHFSVFIKN